MIKYDIQFVIPICLIGKYRKRFLYFKNNGLFNVKNQKVLLTFLCETNEKELCCDGWHENIDAELIHCPHNQESAKVYYYLSNFQESRINEARWIAKIDDDSLTDVDDLVNQLDEFGDYQKEFYFAAEVLNNIEPEELKLIYEFNLQKWFDRQIDGPYVSHEVEGSFLSQKTMQTIYQNEQARNFLKRRSEIKQGYTDIALACAARICKIYPLQAPFANSHSVVGDLSFFGGKLSHIHYFAPDINNSICKLFSECLHNKKPSAVVEEFYNKKYIFLEDKKNICKLQLMPNRKIKILSYVKETPPPYEWTLWDVRKNHLFLVGWDGTSCYKFNLDQDLKKLKGRKRYEDIEGLLKYYETESI